MRPLLRPAALVVQGALLSLPLLAQQSGIGIKAGFALSDLRSGAYTSRMTPNASAGTYFALRAGTRFELQPELLLATLGAGYNLTDGGRATVRTLYAQVPITAKVYIGNTFNVNAGLQMGRLLLAKQQSEKGSADLTENFNHWDHGVLLGMGADLITGTDIGIRFYGGLSPVLANDRVHFPRNRSITASVGRRITRVRSPRFNRKRH